MTQRALSKWLTAVSIATLLPILLFSVYAVAQLADVSQQALTRELVQRTEALSTDVQVLLSAAEGRLAGLATSDAAQHDDIPALYQGALRVLSTFHAGRAITLIAPDGRILFLTLRPLGTAGLQSGDSASIKQVFLTARPSVSGPFKSPISNQIVVAVSVPIIRDGKVVYCLRMVLLASSLSNLLADQRLPNEWNAAILDQRGLIVARAHNSDRYVGTLAPNYLVSRLHVRPATVFEGVTREGTAATANLEPVPGWGWSVMIGVPTSEFRGPLRRSLATILLAGIVSLVIGAIASRWISLRIIRQVTQITRMAIAMRKGDVAPAQGLSIAELRDLAATLSAADSQARRQQDELHRARRDALTGLPGRLMFMEAARALSSATGTTADSQLALLYIDLDGFKAVNDSLGHGRGDQILIQVAQILKEQTRDQDVVGRIGGDEFLVCLAAPPSMIGPTARNVAERVIEQISSLGMGLGCSVGICIPTDFDLDRAIDCADRAMYEAKRRGKGRFVVFGEEG